MNTSLFATGLIASLLSVQMASAEERDSNPTGLYLGANLGYDRYDDDDLNDFEDAGSVGLQLGYRWNDHIRTEFEFSGSGSELDNSSDNLGFVRLTLGAYYDFLPTNHAFVPYVGGGVGTATVLLDSDDGDDEDGGLWSLHGEAGLALNVNEHFAIVPSYRYTWVEDDTNLLEDDLTSHSFRVGARLSF